MRFILPLLISLFTTNSWAQYSIERTLGFNLADKKSNYSLKELNQLVTNLSKKDRFDSIIVVQTGPGKVLIRARLKSKLAYINFTKPSNINTAELMEATGKKPGDYIDQRDIQIIKDKLSNYLQGKGFYSSTISIDKTTKEDKSLVLDAKIEVNGLCLIQNIIIESSNESLKNDLRNYFIEYLNQPLTATASNEIRDKAKDYLTSRRFLEAKIDDFNIQYNKDRSRAKIFVSVKKPTNYEFVFYGNKHFSDGNLLKTLALSNEKVSIEKNLHKIKKAFFKKYKDIGFAEVEIDITPYSILDKHKKILHVKITEGPRFRLRNINISGKISRPPEFYKKRILYSLDQDQGFRFFSEEKMKLAIEDVRETLQEDGFLSAKIAGMKTELNHNYADFEVIYDEGSVTQIRLIKFEGLRSFSSVELMKVIGLSTNQALNLRLVRDSFVKLEKFYKDQGYLEFKINNIDGNIIKYNGNSTFADIVYKLSEGPKIKVKNIKIIGNEKTFDRVLLREIDFIPGDILTDSKVRDSIFFLERTGLFGDVQITPTPVNSPNGNRTILIKVAEKNPGIFSSGLGISAQGLQSARLTYRGLLGVQYSNLFRRAYRASARVEGQYQQQWDYFERKVTFSFYEPFLFKNKTRLRLLLTNNDEIFDTANDILTIREANEIGIYIEKEFGRNYKFTWNFWTLSNQTFSKPRDTNSQDSTTNIGSVGPILEIDYRNNPFLPSSGNYTRFELEYSNPALGSTQTDDTEISFARVSGNYTNYWGIDRAKRWVWANSVRGGLVSHLGRRSDVAPSTGRVPTAGQQFGIPAVKSFFLGGGSTIRGYDVRARRPERVPNVIEACPSCVVLDGNGNPVLDSENNEQEDISKFYLPESSSYFLVKSELRFPFFGNFGGVLFYDGGAVYIKNLNLKDPFRDSAGFGIRYNTQFGALALDVGFKLDPKKNENTHAFHLSIGSF